MSYSILVTDDDTAFCVMLKTFLQKKGYEVVSAFTGAEAKEEIAARFYDIILTDMRLPDADGLDILRAAKSANLETQVILMTGYTDIRAAVNAIKMSAFDYVGKPINPDEIVHTIQFALNRKTANEKNKVPGDEKKGLPAFVKGTSEDSKQLYEHIGLVGPTDMSVLIIGDSGTGKEYIAKEIHLKSKRAAQAYIPVDCGAIPKELASSEFFGHIKGSFTGAVNDKTGHFEAANGGTLFLDEVGNLSYEVQVQLLRALQERKIKPVGSSREIDVDIRVVAATNEDLFEAVKRGDFREDLYHRLNEFCIRVPKLCERGRDIMMFAGHFLGQANAELGKSVQGFSPEVTALFQSYEWPGNLREMKNIIKRSVLLTNTALIQLTVLPAEMHAGGSTIIYSRHNEEEAIKDALERTNNNKSKAARLLDIDRKTLYNKLKLYNLDL